VPAITISTKDGPKVLFAEVFGNLAVHPQYGGGSGYTITHVPSGLSIGRERFTRPQARLIARELNGLSDWPDNVTELPGFDGLVMRSRRLMRHVSELHDKYGCNCDPDVTPEPAEGDEHGVECAA
jgi:hypothetical protein